MSYLKKIVLLTLDLYDALAQGLTVIIGGQTLDHIDDEYIYLTNGGITNNDIEGPISVANGGTGKTSISIGKVLIGNGTATPTELDIINNITPTAVTAADSLITANTLYNHIGNSNLTTVGDVTTGTWHASTVVATNTANNTAALMVGIESLSYKFGWHMGSGGINHGLHDWHKNGTGSAGWVLVADASNNWTFNGNASSATTAESLKLKVLTTSALESTSGSFVFSGTGSPQLSGNDWVGLLVGSTVDKFQIMGGYPGSGSFAFRLNDATNGATSGWTAWQAIAHAPVGSGVGSDTLPVYMTSNGIITAGTALGSAAYSATSDFAPTSHGNHVPTTGTADDLTYLRNDNSWHKITTGNVSSMINLLSTDSSELTSNDYLITQYVGGGSTTATYYRRPANKVVNSTLVKAALGTNSTHGNAYLRKDGNWETPPYPVISVNSKTGAVVLTAGDLNLSSALRFLGISSATLTDGSTAAAVINSVTLTATTGDVVLYNDGEYVWTGTAWEHLGQDSSFKVKLAEVGDPIASGTASAFINSISLDTEGAITVSKANLPIATSAVAGITTVGASDGAAAYSHDHGNLTNDGKVGSTANYAVYTTTDGAITAGSLATSSPSASGSATAFITSVSLDSKGKISINKANLNTSGEWGGDAVYIKCTDSRTTAIAPSDLSAPSKAVRFDFKAKSITGLTANYSGVMSYRPYSSTSDWSGGPAHQLAFDDDGIHWRKSTNSTTWDSWENIALTSDITTAINNLDVSNISGFGAGKTLSALSETDGKISATFLDISITTSLISDFPSTMAPSSHTHAASDITTGTLALDRIPTITNAKLLNKKITINGSEVELGGSLSLEDLGLSGAMHFKGTVTTLPTATATDTFNAYSAGDVVLGPNNKEYIYNKGSTAASSAWIELGSESSFKTIQSTVSDPSAGSTAATNFISALSLNTNGVITATKSPLPIGTTSVTGIVKLGTAATEAAKGDHNHDNTYVAKSAGVTSVTWDSTNNKLTRTINGTTADVVTISTIKTAIGSITPTAHTHGNINNDGTLGTTASYAVVTDANKKITTTNLSVSAPNASGTASAFVSSVTADTLGKIYVARANLPEASSSESGIVMLGASGGAATYDHTHTLSIAEDNGTNALTLAYGTKYKLTAGGSTYIFTMPDSDNTDTHRIVKVDDTQILANNTTALNLKAGSNITISATANSGDITISAADPTVTLNIFATSNTNNYPLLASAYTTSQSTTTASTVNRLTTVYITPSTGMLSANVFSLNLSGTEKVLLLWNDNDHSLDFIFA